MTVSTDFTPDSKPVEDKTPARWRGVCGRYIPSRYRLAVALLIIVFLGLQYRLWIADGGWAQVARLTEKLDVLQADNGQDHTRNDAMQAEIDDLKSGESATEGRARADMGMIKRREQFFLTVAKPASATAPVAGD